MLGFLHTAAVHVSTFARLARELAPEVEVRHAVRDDLLTQALRHARVSEATRAATQAAVKQLFEDGARVVVCTCSTLGDAAEATPHEEPQRVLRVDRPMAERAVALGRPILVVAALPTAMDTALSLLQAVPGVAPPIRRLLCPQAWERFQAGDQQGYLADLSASIERFAQPLDVVLLAQASMAPAAALIGRSDLEVIASPELGVRRAVDLLERTI